MRVAIPVPPTPERGPEALKGEIYVSPYALNVKPANIREDMLPPKTHWRQMFDRVVVQVRQSKSTRQDACLHFADRHICRWQNLATERLIYKPAIEAPTLRHGAEAEEPLIQGTAPPAKPGVGSMRDGNNCGIGTLRGSGLLLTAAGAPSEVKGHTREEHGQDVLTNIEKLHAQLKDNARAAADESGGSYAWAAGRGAPDTASTRKPAARRPSSARHPGARPCRSPALIGLGQVDAAHGSGSVLDSRQDLGRDVSSPPGRQQRHGRTASSISLEESQGTDRRGKLNGVEFINKLRQGQASAVVPGSMSAC